MREVWVYPDAEMVLLETFHDGTSRGYPKSDTGETTSNMAGANLVKYSWRDGEFTAEDMTWDDYPKDLPHNFTPDFPPKEEEMWTRTGTRARDVADRVVYRFSAAVRKLGDKIANRERPGFRKVRHEEFIQCCLPQHHGVIVPGVEAIIDVKLACLIGHIAERHGDRLEFLASCQGGDDDHTVSFSHQLWAGYVSFTGPQATEVVNAFGEDAWFGGDDITNRYPMWKRFATAVEPYGHTVAWAADSDELNIGGVAETILSVLGCIDDDACIADLDARDTEARAACDWCGLTDGDTTGLLI